MYVELKNINKSDCSQAERTVREVGRTEFIKQQGL